MVSVLGFFGAQSHVHIFNMFLVFGVWGVTMYEDLALEFRAFSKFIGLIYNSGFRPVTVTLRDNRLVGG